MFGYDIFCKNLKHKKFKTNLEVSEVLITYVRNKGKARVMLDMGAGHSNNCQIILKLFGYYIFPSYLQHKKIQAKGMLRQGLKIKKLNNFINVSSTVS